jgi:hypothetical protein
VRRTGSSQFEFWLVFHPSGDITQGDETMHAVSTIRKLMPLLVALVALPAVANEAQLLEEARGVATAIPPKLLNVLKEEIAKGGPEGAIGVCREKAPAMAKAASEQTGWAIRRVSLKNRNPKARAGRLGRGGPQGFRPACRCG